MIRARLPPALKWLNLAENDDMPKKGVKAKYGDIVKFGDGDNDDEEEDTEANNDMDAWISRFASTKV